MSNFAWILKKWDTIEGRNDRAKQTNFTLPADGPVFVIGIYGSAAGWGSKVRLKLLVHTHLLKKEFFSDKAPCF